MKLSSGLLLGASLLTASACATVAPTPAVAEEAAAEEAVERPDFSGVWKLTSADRVVMPQTTGTLTPEAQEAYDHFQKYYYGDEGDPAVQVCLSKGMPWTSLIRARDYPVEVYQTEDRIIMMFELYDAYRNIFINGDPKPDYYADGPNGYSVAHWEGDTLVIETTGIQSMNPISPHSRGFGAKVTERWTLKDDPEYGEVFVIDLVQEDPDTYVGPATGHNEMQRAPEGTVVGGYGCSIALWDKFVEEREAKIEAGEIEPYQGPAASH